MSGEWNDKGFQNWSKDKERGIKLSTLKTQDRVRLRINIKCSIIDHRCTVTRVEDSGAVVLTADSEFPSQSYRIAADGWIVLNPHHGLKRKALVTRI